MHQFSEKSNWDCNELCARCPGYYNRYPFAAALGFEIDLAKSVITYCAAGIGYYLHLTGGEVNVISTPGLFLGISDNELYEEHVLPIKPGDALIFMSDGVFELLPEVFSPFGSDFTGMMKWLGSLTESLDCKDDATVLGIYVNKQLLSLY